MEKRRQEEMLRPIARGESFRFGCHPGVACFTECCRKLDLTLTPYDVLRLRQRLAIPTETFLERYTRIGQEDGFPFPQVFLKMRDEAEERCPFVTAEGCQVYEDRPGACRSYPLGRGAFLTPDGSRHEVHVVVSEPHCLGFAEESTQDITNWYRNQDLLAYNAANDELLPLFHHRKIGKDFSLDAAQREAYLLALYRLESFRQEILAQTLNPQPALPGKGRCPDDDLALLRVGIKWVTDLLFG